MYSVGLVIALPIRVKIKRDTETSYSRAVFVNGLGFYHRTKWLVAAAAATAATAAESNLLNDFSYIRHIPKIVETGRTPSLSNLCIVQCFTETK